MSCELIQPGLVNSKLCKNLVTNGIKNLFLKLARKASLYRTFHSLKFLIFVNDDAVFILYISGVLTPGQELSLGSDNRPVHCLPLEVVFQFDDRGPVHFRTSFMIAR